MQLSSETDGSCLVVTVEEERIDAATAVQFKDSMRQLVDGRPEKVLLDLAAVDCIDSSGLGAIVSVMKYLGSGSALELAGLQPKVQTVFRLTRMDHVMRIHESRETALGLVSRAS